MELGERGFTQVLAKVGDVGEVSDRFGLSFGYTLPFPGVETEAAIGIGPKDAGVPVLTGFSGTDGGEVDRRFPFGLPEGEAKGRFACRKLGVPKLFRWQALLFINLVKFVTDQKVRDRPVGLRIGKEKNIQATDPHEWFLMTQLVHYAPEACRNRDVCCIAYKLDTAIILFLWVSILFTLLKKMKRTL